MVPRLKQLSSLLIKPSGPDCNLDCSYCFYLEKADLFPKAIHRMSLDTLELLLRQAMEQSGPRITISWQGGEPTLMGLPWFEKAVEFQEKYGNGKTVGNGLQTNGLLLDTQWARFLKEYRFLVGLSIDGPEHVHDKYRLTQGRKGSWHTVAEKASLLMEEGVEVNSLSVVTDYSSQYAEEIYEYLKSLGFRHMQFIPCVETDPVDRTKAAAYSVSAEAYGRFLVDIFDLWKRDFADGMPTVSIRYFDSVFHKYVGMTAPDCTLGRTCGTYVVVEHNGDVYSCDFFVEPSWKLGNLATDRLVDMLNSDRQNEFGNWKADLPQMCQSCKWLRNCWGGCTKDRIRDPQETDPNHFCKSYMMFFEHADGDLTDLAHRWRSGESSGIRAEPGQAAPQIHGTKSRFKNSLTEMN